MEYRILGKTGLRVSRMGFGGIPIQRIDAEGTKKLMHAMLDMGINYIDSARGYSVSEEYIGYGLEGIREHFILATKSMARTKDAMAADIDISLRNYRTDYIDIYQMHNPSLRELEAVQQEGGALEALLEAKAAGKIRHIGITCHSDAVFKAALELDWVETVMFPYNIVETQGEKLIKQAFEKNIGFIAMKPLAGGAIEDADLAMRYLAADKYVTLAIPGMASIKELKKNAAAFSDASPLTPEEKAKCLAIRSQLGTEFCRRCNYCAPCPQGIVIPNVFTFLAYTDRYDLGDWARSRYKVMKAHASDCIGCGSCESRCPYSLPIRKMLKTAAERFGY